MDSPTSPLSHHASSFHENHHGRLACQACQRKKIKCSRTFPCEQCSRSGLHCVPSTRKPRARHVGKRTVDSELRSRISKLESLVESLSGEVGGGHETHSGSEPEQVPDRRASTGPVGKYMAGAFWSSLTDEVQALRVALEDEPSDDDADTYTPAVTNPAPEAPIDFDLMFCAPGVTYVMPGALLEPSVEVSAQLCDIYLSSVDSFFGMYHGPSLRRVMLDPTSKYLGQDYSSPANRAVRAAIMFSATNTLTEERCIELFGRPRFEILSRLRRQSELMLAQADVVNTVDLATLQAGITYLGALRLTDTSRRFWTMVALFVRIARAMGLDQDVAVKSPYETELRRRIWYAIRFIDLWTSIDRATELLISSGSYNVPFPRNLNDEEFDENSIDIPDHQTGLTKMSLPLLSQRGCMYTTELLKSEDKAGGDTWQQRLELAEKFWAYAQETILAYCDSSITFHRVVRAVVESMSCSMRLRAVRPMHRYVSSVPPPVHSPLVLKIALDSLKAAESLYERAETQPFRWMVWVQWHPLAIVLAGLCFHRDDEIAKTAWPLAERAFERVARHVADTKSGMMWRPLDKLHKKAIAFRDHGTADSTHTSPTQNNSSASPSITSPTTGQVPSSYPEPPLPLGTAIGPYGVNPREATGITSIGIPSSIDNFNDTEIQQISLPTTSGIDMQMEFNQAGLNSSLGFGNDMSWMDFERILEDMSQPPIDTALDNTMWQMPANSGWQGAI